MALLPWPSRHRGRPVPARFGSAGRTSYPNSPARTADFSPKSGPPSRARVLNRFGGTRPRHGVSRGANLGQTANFRQKAPKIGVSPGLSTPAMSQQPAQEQQWEGEVLS